jgi:uncharacterized protein (DUF2141 family)
MKILRLLILILISNLSFAQNSVQNKIEGVTITVKIDNVRNNKGHVVFSLHTKDTFMKKAGIQSSVVTSENGIAEAVFENVIPGNYAIIALHDENDNKKMDFDNSGMPKEDYGMTNNVFTMGPPSFIDGEFQVADKDLNLAIRF